MIREVTWAALESTAPTPSGWAKTRILQQTGHDLWAGVKHPQMYRALLYVIPAEKAPMSKQLPELRHIAVDLVPHDEDRAEVHLRLEDSNLSDVFTALVSDIAERIGQTPSTETGVEALIARLQHWKNLLQPDSGHGLSWERRRGLYGELLVIRRLLDAGAAVHVVVGGWVGPTGAHQDMQTPLAAVEVKSTSTKQPQSVRISSERQLDTTGIENLFLAHASLDERKSGSGESLSAIVADLEGRLQGDLLSAFRQMLYLAGLLPSAMGFYEEPVYTLRSLEYFEVREGFPRIVETMCPDGLGDVHYSIQLGSIQSFSTEEQFLATLLGAQQ